MPTPMTTARTDSTAKQQIGCMEIWGGNDAFDNAISVAGLDAWIHSQPHGDAASGGDIHYISTCGHGRIARFCIADVSGHGATVGDMARQLRKLMRRNMNKLDQTRFVCALNQEFNHLATGGLFATAILTSYFAPTNDLLICNAGHPRPLWYHAKTGDWQFLDEESQGHARPAGNLPLGIIEPTEYVQFAIRLSPGDLIILYSDWLTEAQVAGGGMLGEDGLLNLARTLDISQPDAIGTSIRAKVDALRGSRVSDDDVTLIVLHHTGAPTPPFTVRDWMRSAGKMMGLLKV
jgi:sigma-B regulation protein RsbU (phosphoserine phosphatase)